MQTSHDLGYSSRRNSANVAGKVISKYCTVAKYKVIYVFCWLPRGCDSLSCVNGAMAAFSIPTSLILIQVKAASLGVVTTEASFRRKNHAMEGPFDNRFVMCRQYCAVVS